MTASLPLRRVLFWAAALFAFVMAILPHPPELPGNPSDKLQHMAAFAPLAGSVGAGGERGFWLGTGIVLILLGINKQLDLQSDLTRLAKVVAHVEGWYDWRRDVQGVFLLLIALGAIGFGLFLWRWLRGA